MFLINSHRFIIYLMFIFGISEIHSLEKNYVHTIGPRDKVSIRIYKSPELNTDCTVRHDGSINIPFLGNVVIEGMTEREAQNKIKNLLEDGYLVQAEVTLQITSFKSKTATVIGKVNSPGEIILTRKLTLINALSLANGVNAEVIEKIMVIRKNETKEQIFFVDYQKLYNEGDMSLNIKIQNKDIIIVLDPNNSKGKYYITGEVKTNGAYDLEGDDFTVIKAVSLAGGTTNFAATRGIIIKRTLNGKELTIKAKLNTKVKENDIIFVPRSFF